LSEVQRHQAGRVPVIMKNSRARLRNPGSATAAAIEAPRYLALPDFIPPELATLVSRPPQGRKWLHEIKVDGYRTAGRVAGGKVRMLTRHGLDWTARFAPIADALATLNLRSAYIDGEIVVQDQRGVSSFGRLQEALSEGPADRLLYYGFDLLHLDGQDMQSLPLVERKAALEVMLPGSGIDGRVRYAEHHASQAAEFFN
jgi:bifunctional non-homologous end joining protein LigD